MTARLLELPGFEPFDPADVESVRFVMRDRPRPSLSIRLLGGREIVVHGEAGLDLFAIRDAILHRAAAPSFADRERVTL